MSRGFVKEDEEETPIVPPRADLPEGVVNYVTQGGMDNFERKQELISEKRIWKLLMKMKATCIELYKCKIAIVK
jgi:hypothetical protein